MKRVILNPDELSAALKTLDGWTVDGKMLKKSCKFENFADALEFVNRVGAVAESTAHHPDITFGWGYAELALTTHDRGGITDVDMKLAKRINGIRDPNGSNSDLLTNRFKVLTVSLRHQTGPFQRFYRQIQVSMAHLPLGGKHLC